MVLRQEGTVKIFKKSIKKYKGRSVYANGDENGGRFCFLDDLLSGLACGFQLRIRGLLTGEPVQAEQARFGGVQLEFDDLERFPQQLSAVMSL